MINNAHFIFGSFSRTHKKCYINVFINSFQQVKTFFLDITKALPRKTEMQTFTVMSLKFYAISNIHLNDQMTIFIQS